MKRILGLRKTLGVLLGALAVACLSTILSPQVVFADASWSRTMTYTAQTEGYDSPSLTITANVNDAGIITSGLAISAGNGFSTDAWYTVDGNYNGPLPEVVTDNSSNEGHISVQTLSNPNRTELDGLGDFSEDSQETLNQAVEIPFEFGVTSFEELTNAVFNEYAGSYTYTDRDARTVNMVTINDCNDPTVQYVDGPRNCYEGEFVATDGEIITATGGGVTVDNSWFTFNIGRDASTYRLDCSADSSVSGCGANDYSTESYDADVQYNKTIESMEEVMATAGAATEIDPTTGETTTEGETSGEGGEEADPCYSNSGALGWIFCPIITGLGDFLNDVYTTIIENFLAIDPQLLSMIGSTGSQNGTYTAWNIFRNIANVILIIMLLVVVLSQLTGFGISNYGIKKSLPRIVALAIIINVSFIICQLAVDIANIIGYSLNDLLSSIADQVVLGSGIAGGANGIQDFLSYFLIGGGALIAAGVAAAFAGWALIIPVLLVLLSGALAVIFLFLLLGVRQAIIVLLVALSPVIVVLFVLPNTQKLAQRGLRMFMMLLAIFPAAGLLVGGGYLASAILMSTSASMDPGAGWLLEIIALALLVVPFFLLPLLIRSGFRAADGVLGMLSARGQGITANLKGRARTGLKDSNLDKTLQTRAANRSINRRGIKVGNHRIGQGAQGRALYHSKKAAESSGVAASWHRMRANRAQNAVVKQGALADRNEKQRTDDAIAAIDRVYADSTTGEMIAVMDNMLASGAANSDSGQRQLAAMMASVSKRQDGGVALTNFLEDNGLGEENKKNLPALKRGLAAGDTMKNLSDTSIRAGTIAGEIASATRDSNGGYKATRDRQAMAAEVASKISSAAPAKLAAQQKDEFKSSIEHITPENAREILRNPDLRSKIAGSTDDPDSSLARLTVRAGAGASAGSAASNTAASSAAPRTDAASASINLDDVSRETLIVPHGVQGENVVHASQADMEAMARKLRDDQDRRRGRRR